MRDSGDGAGDWEVMYIHRCTHMHACISHWTHILYLQSFKDSKEERERGRERERRVYIYIYIIHIQITTSMQLFHTHAHPELSTHGSWIPQVVGSYILLRRLIGPSLASVMPLVLSAYELLGTALVCRVFTREFVPRLGGWRRPSFELIGYPLNIQKLRKISIFSG